MIFYEFMKVIFGRLVGAWVAGGGCEEIYLFLFFETIVVNE